MIGTPFDVLYDIMFNFSTWVSMFTTLIFFELPFGYSIFNVVFTPVSFIIVFGLMVAKKLVPTT
jgi:hypothetical protein